MKSRNAELSHMRQGTDVSISRMQKEDTEIIVAPALYTSKYQSESRKDIKSLSPPDFELAVKHNVFF